MKYFNPETYDALLRKTRAESTGKKDDDLHVVTGLTEDLIRYVYEVCSGENRMNSFKERVLSEVESYDSKRHTAHENAILAAKMLNRLAGEHGIGEIYAGDPAERHQVADFCLEAAGWLFENRRRVL